MVVECGPELRGPIIMVVEMRARIARPMINAELAHRGAFFGADFILGIVEDGGEMLTAAVALSTALLLFRHLDDLRRPSRRGVRSR